MRDLEDKQRENALDQMQEEMARSVEPENSSKTAKNARNEVTEAIFDPKPSKNTKKAQKPHQKHKTSPERESEREISHLKISLFQSPPSNPSFRNSKTSRNKSKLSSKRC